MEVVLPLWPGAIGYLVLDHSVVAINKEIDMGVLGGLITGPIAGLLYNRFHQIKLPDWLAFFGGRRFVPIVTAATMVLLGGVFGFIWPPIQSAIHSLGQWIIDAGAVGVGVYGFLNRLLIPVGLHHVLNSLVWFVFGEYEGATGDLHRFFAGDPSAGIFMAGFFPVMMFGMPAAALAMILTARKSRRAQVAGMMGSIALTSFVTGITEPIEFSFMFLSPLLYGIHALLTASSMVVAYVMDIHHGFGFSAGAIDFFLNLGLAKGAWSLLGVGLVYGVIYFAVFYLLIKKLNLKTPGREDEEATPEDTKDSNESSNDQRATLILQDLGGDGNIASLEYCATRLRLQVHDMEKVDEAGLKKHGAKGVIRTGKSGLQVIIGTDVEFVANSIQHLREQNGSHSD